MPRTRTTIDLRAGPLAAEDVEVLLLRGSEAISAPFVFHVEFHRVDGEKVPLSELVGAEGQVVLRRTDGTERIVHGIVDAAELAGVDRHRPRYRVRIVPRLALLAHGQDSRIFQAKTVVEIVKEVLDERKVVFRSDVKGTYPTREYCVQYREPDLAFVERLLAEEGIFYFFGFEDGKHTLVLADAPDAFADVEGHAQIPFRPGAETSVETDVEHLSRLVRATGVRPGRATRRDFDWRRPALDTTCSVSAGASGAEIYECRLGPGDAGQVKRLARVSLEEARSDEVEVEGEGSCVRVFPGRRFEVVEHEDATLNQKYEVVGVEHEARQEERAGAAGEISDRHRFRFVAWPAGTPVRPEGKPRAVLPGTQTATAVGPAGEEIHVDEHGRIKVQFHWDRHGKKDDKSSCWIRVAHPWAGAGPGFSRIPRIGQEVVVRFLDGDPDRPLVIGAVYDGANPPPIALPGEKTRSTVRSDSSPGSGGSNELRLEDAAGSEEIFRHAQKDEKVKVEHDAETAIGHDATLEVGKDRTVQVGRNQALEVARRDDSHVVKDRSLTVAAARSTVVTGSQEESVTGNQSVNVGGSQQVRIGVASEATIGAAGALTVGGGYAITVGAAYNTAVGGLHALQVGGEELLISKGSSEETVGRSFDRKVGGDHATSVEAGVTLGVGGDFTGKVSGKESGEAKAEVSLMGKQVRLQAEDELVLLVGGKLLVSLKQSGDVKISASVFSVKADGDLKLKGGEVKMTAGDATASKMIKVKALEKIRQSRGTATVAVEDANGKPLASVRFRAELPDGTVTEGVTDASGHASIPSPKEGEVTISFPDVDDDSWRAA